MKLKKELKFIGEIFCIIGCIFYPFVTAMLLWSYAKTIFDFIGISIFVALYYVFLIVTINWRDTL